MREEQKVTSVHLMERWKRKKESFIKRGVCKEDQENVMNTSNRREEKKKQEEINWQKTGATQSSFPLVQKIYWV